MTDGGTTMSSRSLKTTSGSYRSIFRNSYKLGYIVLIILQISRF